MAARGMWAFHQVPFLSISSLFWGTSQRHISKNKAIIKRLGFPEKPKLPCNSFILFSKDIRPKIQAQNPQLNVTEISKIASQKWKALSENERNKYKNEFKENLATYKNDIALYNKSISEEQKLQMKELMQGYKISKQDKMATASLRKLSEELKKPKKPLSPFLLFKCKHFNDSNTDLPVKKRMKLLGEQWSKISDSEKEKYRSEYKKNFTQYLKDIEKWEEKMIKEGHSNLVRPVAFLIHKNSK